MLGQTALTGDDEAFASEELGALAHHGKRSDERLENAVIGGREQPWRRVVNVVAPQLRRTRL